MRPISRFRARRVRRAGMTLVELTMAVALSSGVALGIGYVVRQMSGAVISVERRAEAGAEASLAIHRLRSELRQATTLVALGSTKITFEHPDVTGDGQSDLVSYSWAGTPGQPLNRSVNGGTAEALIATCTAFRLAAASRVGTCDLLASHDRYAENIVYAPQQFTITDMNHCAEVFTVSGSGAPGFRIEKVRLWLRGLSSVGTLTLELRGASGGVPNGPIFDQVTRAITQINTMGGWEEFQFASASGLPTGGQYALVLKTNSQWASVATGFDQITVSPPAGSSDFYRYSNNGGGTWGPFSGFGARDLKYYIYGRYTDGAGQPLPPSGGPIGSVFVHLESGAGVSATVMDVTVQCLNNPELSG